MQVELKANGKTVQVEMTEEHTPAIAKRPANNTFFIL